MDRTAPEASPLSDDARWAAVVSCDSAFDGLFLYGVTTTGIFCRPSCRSKTPRRENVLYFEDASRAAALGFRPCRRCRPDLPATDPARELVDRAKALLSNTGCPAPSPDAVAAALGVSPSALRRAFKAVLGVTPARHAASARVGKACRLLLETGASIAETSLECGFESLSSFYKCFKELTGTSPARFREEARRTRP
ncbi:MAG: bifunctional transcriptional activator/DNA repair enzyme AdaA [Thermodesulfobacteriota bacterium]|jgi:AraC family transcriptional regulator of adaptative response / methylphosphotriester-DNA alkyltransferase methyltransferase